MASEKSFLSAERLWLIHRGGFTSSFRLPSPESTSPSGSGKIRIQLEETQEILSVDEDDVEKANPIQFDRVEDLSQLRYLNESSVLHTLRQRYAENLIHTYAGNNMLIINPMAPLAIYSDKVCWVIIYKINIKPRKYNLTFSTVSCLKILGTLNNKYFFK